MSRAVPVGVGVIGAGVISDAYLDEPDAVPRRRGARSSPTSTRARPRRRPRSTASRPPAASTRCSSNPDVEIVVNLTIPAAHVEVALPGARGRQARLEREAVRARPRERAELLAAADGAGLRVGCAPDTFLGAGLQTARRPIDDGRIGDAADRD